MEAQKLDARALLTSFLLAALATQAFLAVAVSARSGPMEKTSQDDVKKPDCVPGVDPRSFPGHGGTTFPIPSHGGSGTTPSHGGSGTTPYHGGSGTTPSHGGSGTATDPSHGGSGSTPTSPSGGYGSTPTPSHGGSTAPSTGGGYGSSPTTPPHGGAYGSSPTPSHGGAYGGSPPASTPSHSTPTATPLVSINPGTCEYWRSHPMQIWSALGQWPSSVSHFFGAAGGAAAGGSNLSIQDALANTRSDGAGALLREGTAALLNSMTRSGFPYTTDQVRNAFAAAAGGSDSAAATQAAAFKKANEGKA